MLHARRGFTLIEISLFLAITAVIFAGIVAGTQNSIYWQRYNDSVQSFAEFLRAEYSRVANVQNPTGNGASASNEIIYGRLINFADPSNIKSYSVIGGDTTEGLGNGTVKAQLMAVDANVDSRGLQESYAPKWGSRIQLDKTTSLFGGSILIVRSPETGTIYTYINLNQAPQPGTSMNLNNYELTELQLCVNPDGDTSSGSRRKVTITANAHNASGVVVDGECEWSPTS